MVNLTHAEEGAAGVDLEAELDGDDYDSADFTKPLFLAKARSEAEDVSVTRAI